MTLLILYVLGSLVVAWVFSRVKKEDRRLERERQLFRDRASTLKRSRQS